MKFNPDIHRRHSIRLKGYDYSKAGAYFVTVCAWNRECLFGDVAGGEIRLNEYGTVVVEEWQRSGTIRKEIVLDVFVVMPNHIHGIIMISDDNHGSVGVTGRSPLQIRPHGPSKRSLGSFFAGFKSSVTKRINELRDNPECPVWQRNYYDHVIRTEDSLNRIRDYIHYNPARWDEDIENPVIWDEKKAKAYYNDVLCL